MARFLLSNHVFVSMESKSLKISSMLKNWGMVFSSFGKGIVSAGLTRICPYLTR